MPNHPKDSRLDRWHVLLEAARRNAAEIPGLETYLQALERAYTETLFNERTRETLRASLQQASLKLRLSVGAGCDAATSLRNFVRSVLGLRSEKLRDFGMKPRGKRCLPGRKPAGGAALPSPPP